MIWLVIIFGVGMCVAGVLIVANDALDAISYRLVAAWHWITARRRSRR